MNRNIYTRGAMPTWAIVALSVLGVLVALGIIGFLFLTFVVKSSLDDARSKSLEIAKAVSLSTIATSLELAYDENDQKYPTDLSGISNPGVDMTGVMYAYSPDQKRYHLGIRLSDPATSSLGRDDDFDSSLAGYINGFAGADPVFDLKSMEF